MPTPPPALSYAEIDVLESSVAALYWPSSWIAAPLVISFLTRPPFSLFEVCNKLSVCMFSSLSFFATDFYLMILVILACKWESLGSCWYFPLGGRSFEKSSSSFGYFEMQHISLEKKLGFWCTYLTTGTASTVFVSSFPATFSVIFFSS